MFFISLRLKIDFQTDRDASHDRVFRTVGRAQLHVPQIEIAEREQIVSCSVDAGRVRCAVC